MKRAEALLYQPPAPAEQELPELPIVLKERRGWKSGTMHEALAEYASSSENTSDIVIEYQDGNTIKGGTIIAVHNDSVVIGVAAYHDPSLREFQSTRLVPLNMPVLFTKILHSDNAAFPSWKTKIIIT